MRRLQHALVAAVSGGGFLSTWALTASLCVSLTFMGPYFTPASGIGLLGLFVASALSWAVLAALLVPFALAERAQKVRSRRVVMLVIVVTLAAAARPWLIDVVLELLGLPTTPQELLLSRVATNAVVWWTVLIVIAMLRNQVRALRDLNCRLGEVVESMRFDAEALARKARDARDEISKCQADLGRRLETLMQRDGIGWCASEVLAFSEGPVREWSRTLSSFSLVLDGASEKRTPNQPETQSRIVPPSLCHLRVPPVGVVVLVYLVLALPYGIRELRPGLTLAILAVLAIFGILADWMPRSLLARWPARRQFLCFLLVWLVAGVITSAMVVPAGAVPLYLAWFPVLVLPIVAIVCGWSAGLLHGLTAEGNRLESMIRQRRLQLVEGVAAPRDALRLAANLLHRDVQADCLLYAAGDLDAAAQHELLSRVSTRISKLSQVVDRAEDLGAGVVGIKAMVNAWSGVIDVRLTFDAAALELIDCTPMLARHVGEVVTEGLVNTVKHADELVAKIDIRALATGAGRVVLVEVSSPGTLSAGARIRADSAVGLLGGELVQEASGVRLSARFSVSAVVPTAHFAGVVTI